MKVALVGAFDRNNYGDILMPIVMTNQMREVFKNVEIEYFGLSDSKMEYTGGYNTRAFSEIYREKFDAVIYVGGEILTSKYTGMYLNLQKSKIKIFMYKCLRRLFNDKTENHCRKLLGGKSLKPWITNKNDLGCKALIYNTIGGDIYFGTNNQNKKEVEKNIELADYISIRENESYRVIKNINQNTKLYPDSVVALSVLIHNRDIEKKLSKEIKNEINKKNNYFVFQVNIKNGKNNIKNISNQIKDIYQKTGMKCVLLPIGYAQGHEDNVVLKKIYNKINDENIVYMPSFNNIYETIYIIKNSKLYVGTSLHGAITAISYNVPHIALTSNIKKLLYFLKTWKTTPIINTEIEEMSKNVQKIIKDYRNAKVMVTKSSSKMVNLVKENFNNINLLLKGINNE